MANLNKVMLMGNLTRDPEVSFLPSQTAICKLGLAVNRSWTAQDGQKKEETTFVDCTAFGKTGEIIGKYLKKGRPIFIEGRLQYRTWEAQDGSKRSKLDVIVESFQFIDSKPAGAGGDGEGGGGGGGYAPRAAAPARQYSRPPAQAAPQQAAPAYDNEPPAPDDDGPPAIREDDIPF